MPRRAALAFVLVAFGACAPAASDGLLDVSEATPASLEPGDVLHVLGSGFPAGRDAQVSLRGEVRRAGQAPAPVEVAVAGRAATSDRVDVPVAGELRSALAGATFRGELRVVFAGREGDVAGSAPHVRLVVARDGPTDARLDARRARTAEAFRRFLGVTIDEEADVSGGVRVASVRAGAPAATAGLLAGDVIAEVDGAELAGQDDLLATPGAHDVRLAVRRAGRTSTLAVPLEGIAGEPPAVATLLAIGLAVLGLFVLVWRTPLAGAVDGLARRAERLFSRPSPRAETMLAVLTAACFAGAAAGGVVRRVDVVGLAVAAAAARLLARIAAGAVRSPRAVARVSLRAVAGLAAAAALVAPLGTSALDGVVDAQAGAAGASVFRGPLQLLCALALVEALVVSEAPRAARGSPAARVLDALATALAVTVVVVGACGAGAPLSGGLSVALAVLEAAALAWMAARWRGDHALPDVSAVALGAGAALATLAALAFAPRLLDDALLARATRASLLLAAAVVGWMAVRARVSGHGGPRWELPRFL